MSRGLGAVQCRVLGQLSEEWTYLADLHGPGATRAVVESIRRALRSLNEAGLVDLGHLDREVSVRGAHRPARRAHKVARLMPPPEVLARERADRARRLDEILRRFKD
ncbi:MAG: hypothetical protein WDA07_12990 [Leucobacter sp.]